MKKSITLILLALFCVCGYAQSIAISLVSNPEGAGTLTGGGNYAQGQTCTIAATPNEGYVFSKWKKVSSEVSCLPTYSFSVTSAAQYTAYFKQLNENDIVIGEPTSASNSYYPTSTNPYSLTQQIYTAEELNTGACEISSLSFFNAGYSRTRNLTIYMVNTNKSSFDSNTDWITVNSSNMVFSGTFSMSYYDWSTVYFNTPFNYDGSSNIALIVDDNTGTWDNYYYTRSRVFDTESPQAIMAIGSNENYDPYHPTAYNGTRASVKNQIIFGIPEYEYTATAIADPEEGGEVTGGGGSYYYGQPILFTATANEGYVFNNWTKPSDWYYGYTVASYMSSAYLPVTSNVEYTAHFQEMDGLIIGEAEHTNENLPAVGYPYSMSQQIYTADELNTGACEITSVSFYNTGSYYEDAHYAVYMVSTNKTGFNSTTEWIGVTNEDMVYNGALYLNENEWVTFYFNTPFSYDGSSNLALVVCDESGEWAGGLSCRTFDTEGHQAIYAYDEYDPINTNSTVGTLLSEKNQVVFGVASYDYTITLSADPEEGGTVDGGGGQYYYGQYVPVSATPNPGYVFNNWSKHYEEYEYGYLNEYDEVVSYLSSDNIFITESGQYVAHFDQKDGIIIGEAGKTSQNLPVHYYPNSMSQQIYTAAEMGRQGQPCQISSVSFFNTEYDLTRDIDVYMVSTSKSAFSGSKDWVAVTEGDMVFSGVIANEGNGWTTIYFSVPFSYDGSSNVALVVNDKTGQWGWEEKHWRTFNTPNTQAMYVYGEDSSFDPYHPSSYTGVRLTEKNQVIFDIASYDYSVTVTANPSAGGTAIGGGGQYYYGQPIPLAATPNPGYVFSSWTKDGEVVSCFPDFTLSVTETAEYVANFMQVDGILVGEPSQATSYLPTNYYSFYALTEQIYTADELSSGPCEIASLSFFNAGVGRTRNLAVYMVHTDKTAFDSSTDWIPVTESDTILFSGNVNFPSKSWATIYFAKPFYYDGSSNVALIVDDNTNGYYHEWGSENFKCRTFDTESTQVLCISNSSNNSTNYDPYNPSSYSGSRQSVKNQIIFGYTHYNYSVTASANPVQGGDVGGDIGLHYYGQPITLTATTNTGYVFNNWTKNNVAMSYLSSYNFPVTETAEYVANFQQVEGIAIGDAVSTSSSLPTNSNSYTLTQQIYTADELNVTEPCEISSVSFFNTGSVKNQNLAIYLVHTGKTAFEGTTDWITVTEADMVFNGTVTMTAKSWITINFSEVFHYNGSSNIALIVDDNTGNNWNSGLSCRTFGTDVSQAIYVNGFGTNYNPYSPSSYNGTLFMEKNQVVFGSPSYNYAVTATASPAEGGTVSGGGEGYFLGQLCTLTATPNTGYLFYNWTLNGTVVSADETYTFPVTGNMNLVANFGVPIVVTVTANPSEGGTVSGGGGFGYNHSCTVTATANPGYVFTNWTKNGTAVWYRSTYTFSVTEAAEYVANFEPVNNGVAIGDAVYADYNYQLPYSYYPYSLTQQIYTADELNVGACQIASLSLFNISSSSAHKLTVYMVNTTKTSFESETDWITVTEADKVFEGHFTTAYHEWSTLYFNTPFSYDGTSNIALIVDDNSNDWLNTVSVRSFDAESTQAIRIYGSEVNFDPYHPTVYHGTCLSVKNQVVFGFPTYGYSATVSANPQEGGTVSGGGDYYFYGQNINISATHNPGYAFNNWTKNGSVVSYYSTDNVSVTGNTEYVANFQQMEGIVIGEPLSSNQNLPTYGYDHNMSQQIYTAAEMGGMTAEISSVSFFNTGDTKYRYLDVYMVHTNKTSFANTTDWITVTEADKVYNSNSYIIVAGHDWTTIYFNTPFNYDGTSNVALIVVDNSNSYNSGLRFRTFETNEKQAIYTYTSSSNIDPCNPSGNNGSLVQEKNQVVFGTVSYDYTTTISIDPEEGGTVVGGEGPCYYGQPLIISVAANPGYVFNNWTKPHVQSNGYTYDEVVSYLSTDVVTVTESSEYVAHFQPMDGIIIGEATHTTLNLPTSQYYYSMSQQIFTAEEMNADSCEISSVSFFNTDYSVTRNLEVYLVNTSKDAFTDANDWIAVTEADKVLSGSVTFAGYNWTTVYFSTPFIYDGTSNVALVVCDKTGQYGYKYCRTFDTQSTQAMFVSVSNAIDPSNPSSYNGTLLTEKNQVVFGIADYQYMVTVSANPGEGGTAVGGGGPYYYGQPIPLAATANPGYVFSSWTKDGEVVSCFPEFILNVTETAEYVANFKPVDGILIGEPAHASSYVPTYYHKSLTQQIYTAAEMGGASCQISSVSFFNTGTSSKTRNLDIYMVNTDKTAFESNTDWIAVTPDDDVLFSGQVTFAAKSWITIYFANPFYYDGSSNVVLIVDDNTNNSNYGDIRCRTFDTENPQALRVSNSSTNGTNYDPYNPSDYTGSLLSEKNQVIFGYAHFDYDIVATANPTFGGFVNNAYVYYGSHYYGQPVTLTATPKSGYVFTNWTKDEGDVVSDYPSYSFSVTETAAFVANFKKVAGIAIGTPAPTTNYYYLPIYSRYSLTEQIFTTDEMGSTAREISSVSFYNAGAESNRNNIAIYMVHVGDKTTFDNTTDWIAVTENDKVFYGSVNMPAHEWTTINFNKLFNYDGLHNVVLVVDNNSNTNTSNPNCRTFGTNDDNQSIRISSSSTNFDPCNPTGFTGVLASQKNQVIFGYPNYAYTVTASANPTNGGTVSGGGEGFFLGQSCTLTATETNPNYRFYNWTLNGEVVSNDATYTFAVTGDMHLVANFGEPIGITVSVNPAEGGTVTGGGGYGLNQPCTLTATANPGYVFTKWTKGNSNSGLSFLSTYTVTVTEATNYVAHFEQVNNGIAIGDAVSTHSYLPTYTYHQYSMSQQIYTAEELGNTEHEISSVSFFNAGYSRTRNLTVYLVYTNKTTFADGSDWITVTDNDIVFSGNVNFRYQDWTNVYFAAPFSYDGSSNIALIVDDNTGSTSSSTNCRTFSTSGNQAIYVSGSNTNYDPCNPTGITGTVLAEKNQVVFGIASYDYMVTLSANPTYGGTVSGGGGPYYLGQPCTVTATPNPGYCFYNWKRNGGVVSTEVEYTFQVMGNTNLVAYFGSPIHITATVGTEGGGTVTGGGDYGDYHTCTLTAIPNPGYVFIKWMKTGSSTPVSYFSTYSFTVHNAAEYVAVFELVAPNIAIGDAEASSYILNSSGFKYTLSQQIYTAEEMGLPGEIHSVSFFSTTINVTRNYSIYMKHTDKTAFGSYYDWVPISAADQVFSGNVTMTEGNWTEIVFDTPFQYDGTSNIVLVINDVTGSYGGPSCRVFEAGSIQTTYAVSDYNSIDPYSTSHYGNRSTTKTQIILGFTPSAIEQTVALSEGWNWFSTYVEVDDPVAMLQTIEAALGGNGVQIESFDDLTEFDGEEWYGGLDELGIQNEQTYLILTNAPCTVQLQGMPANPANHPITIYPGWNWIGFPCTQPLSVVAAFANFVAEDGDLLERSDAFMEFDDGEWYGDIEMLLPGEGYMYFSNSTQTKILVFPVNAK